MKKRILSLLVVLALCLGLLPISAMAAEGGVPWSGAGTEADPYQVTTADDLKALAENVNSGTSYSGQYFKQMNDIDLGGNEENQWTPIGRFVDNTVSPFAGTFDGDGYKITGLYINTEAKKNYQGLFGYTTGTIQNVIVAGSITNKLGWYIGAVTAINNGGTLTDCYNLAALSGGSFTGGVVGINAGSVKDCYNGGSVESVTYAGGIAAYCDTNSGTMENCYNIGTVKGGYAGGITGWCNGGAIDNCYNMAAVTGGSFAGGIVGGNQGQGQVKNCHNTGVVSGVNYVGGVIGYNGYNTGGTVTFCSNTGTVTASGTNVGGVVGNNASGGIIQYSYNTAMVTGKSGQPLGGVGGVVGFNGATGSTVTNCYNTGSVEDSGMNVGGVVGVNGYGSGAVENCYNAGAVTGGTNVGGIIGYQFTQTNNCYYLDTTAEKAVGYPNGPSTGVESKSADGFKDISNLTGFDSSVWQNDETLKFPVLTSNQQVPTYTVSFDSNSGTDGIDAISGISGSYTLPLCTFTAPAGKQFIAWALSSIDGTQYAPGATIPVNENTTLCAIWKSLKHQVTVKGGSGSGDYTPGESVTIKADIPAGQRFVRWTSEGNVTFTDETAATTTFTMPDSDVTVTANMASTAQDAPSAAPELKSRTTTSITLKEVVSNENGAAAEYGILIDGVWTWQGSPTFTNLNTGTEYTFAVRYGATENGNYVASPASASVRFSTSQPSGGIPTPTYRPIVEKSENGTVSITPTNPKQGTTVTVTPEPDDGYETGSVTVKDKNGNPVKVTDNGDGTYSFTQPAGKVTISASFEKVQTPVKPVFTDVSPTDYYYDAVQWAVENGVTTGTTETTFEPNASCTRAQAVTFLWRAAGCPAAEGVNPFADVRADAYYYDAVLWAVENGVTVGTSATTFSPDLIVTRAQVVTFLYRYADALAEPGDTFTDVATDAYYAPAVQWAVDNDITVGTSDTTFSPNDDCTRAQIVTFLFRDRTK